MGSDTIPNTAMRTAPPAINNVPRIIHGENISPNRSRAKNAFQRRETAPNGARITTGREAICTREPRMLEEMKTAKPRSHSLPGSMVSLLCVRSGHEVAYGLRCSTRC